MCSPSQGYYQSIVDESIKSNKTLYNHQSIVEALASVGITRRFTLDDITIACALSFAFAKDKDSEHSMVLRAAFLDVHFHGELRYIISSNSEV